MTERVALHRIGLLTHIIRLLLKIIPSERGYRLREDPPEYGVVFDVSDLLQNVPLPSDAPCP